MTPPTVNPSPKARFMAVASNLREHRAMIEKPEFDRAIDAAQLEYQKLLAGQAVDGNTAMSAGFRAQGAIEFIGILKTLAESVQMPAPRRDPDNLPNVENLKRQ
jgi:hypothetical protein